MRVLAIIFIVLGSFLILVALLFRMMYWPGFSLFTISGLVLLVIGLILFTLRKDHNNSNESLDADYVDGKDKS